MKITIAQLNPVVGDIAGNVAKIRRTMAEVHGQSDLAVFPELFLVGYPPRDLLERADFLAAVRAGIQAVVDLSRDHPQSGILFGAPQETGGDRGKGLYNAAILAYQGRILHSQPKSLLPTYDVFDEARYFDPAPAVRTAVFKDETLGISVCEDAWNDPECWPRGRAYGLDPLAEEAGQGATLFLNISASPFHMGKESLRHRLLQRHATRHRLPIVYVNQIGANDELIFDGRSLALDANGDALYVGAPFAEEIRTIETANPGVSGLYLPQEEIASVHEALVLGIRDYMRKIGFTKAVVGLSGGIDSALTCCLAVAALGPQNVLGVSMPSPYSSRGSVDDSRASGVQIGDRIQDHPHLRGLPGIPRYPRRALRRP